MATVKSVLHGKAVQAGAPETLQAQAGLVFNRFFTDGRIAPFDAVEWEKRTALIGNERHHDFSAGQRRGSQELVANRDQHCRQQYFHGKPGSAEREGSVRQLIGRVVSTIVRWGVEGGYFADSASRDAFKDELTHLLVEQKMAFNSPVWFNVGVQSKPQCSACFINSVQDNMESIMGLTRTKACSSSGAPVPARISRRCAVAKKLFPAEASLLVRSVS